MGQEVPQVKNGPLANALNSIRDPAYVDSTKKNSMNKSARGGRGGRAGRGRGGGRSSAYSSAANSRASSRASSMTSGNPLSDVESGDEAAAAAAAGVEGEVPAVDKWLRAPQSALERAAGELAACDIAVGSR
jgi:hypothetical protein